MISIVACCHDAKLCTHAARDFRSQHQDVNSLECVLSTMGVSKESISKFLIGNRFHVKLRILSPYSNLFEYGLRMRNKD